MKITDDNFEAELAAADQPVMLLFRASFCGPSAMLDPLIDQLSDDFESAVTIVDIDVEANPKLTRAMQVKGTPMLVVVKAGTVIASRVGTSSYEDLTEWADKALNPKP